MEADCHHAEADDRDARVGQVGAEGSPQHAHGDAHDGGEQHGEHVRDGNEAPRALP